MRLRVYVCALRSRRFGRPRGSPLCTALLGTEGATNSNGRDQLPGRGPRRRRIDGYASCRDSCSNPTGFPSCAACTANVCSNSDRRTASRPPTGDTAAGRNVGDRAGAAGAVESGHGGRHQATRGGGGGRRFRGVERVGGRLGAGSRLSDRRRRRRHRGGAQWRQGHGIWRRLR